MRFPARSIQAAILGVFVSAAIVPPVQAETGSVRVVFTKAAVVVGLGVGRGVLTFRGHQYPFKVSGASFGAMVSASITRLVGEALNLRSPGDFAGTYTAIGVGGALAGGAGSVVLQNSMGVILHLTGVKVGVELSASVGGMQITME
jgi:hypothetical protein